MSHSEGGTRAGGALISCRQRTSGRSRATSSSTCASRARIPFTFQLATFIRRSPPAPEAAIHADSACELSVHCREGGHQTAGVSYYNPPVRRATSPRGKEVGLTGSDPTPASRGTTALELRIAPDWDAVKATWDECRATLIAAGVPPDESYQLAMVTQELLENAVKYGAFNGSEHIA